MEKEKQKIVLVAVLGVVVLGVGAFQMMSSEDSAPKKKDSAKRESRSLLAENEENPLKEELRQLVNGNLPQRDPFEPREMPRDPSLEPKQEKPEPTSNQAPRSAGGRKIYQGDGSIGSTRPWNPQISGLPDAMQSGPVGNGGGNATIQPGAPLRQPGEPAYNVTGVLVGKKPVAVLQSDDGRQFLVPVGGNVGGDTEVVAIERGKVTVRHKGKVKVLKLEGGASDGK